MAAIPPPRNRRAYWLFAALILAAGSWASGLAAPTEAGAKPPAPLVGRPLAERKILIVGATTDSYPYGYVGADGGWTGFGGELLNAVARVMNLRIERVLLPGRVVQERFRQGDFDLLQALSQTAEREAYAEFSVPYLTLQGAVFVQKHDSPIRSIEDLNGRKFALIGANSIGAQFLHDHRLQMDTVLVSSTEEGLRLVESGVCAGTFASQLTALSVIEHTGFKNVAMLGEPFPNYDIRHCFAVHRGDAQLLARLNEGLAILHSTGEYDKIYDHWFGRLTAPLISRQQIVIYGVAMLALALLVALWGLQRQRRLRRHISRQTAELTGQATLLQALYDNVPMAMCVLEAAPDGYRVLSINRQAEPYFGVPAADVAGRPLAELAPDPEWLSHLFELLQRGLTSRTFLREERLLSHAHKRLIFTLVPMAPDDAGHVRLCVLAEDITQRRNLDEEIAQSRKLRAVGELVGGIAHEFNNLLTPIMLKVGQIEADWAHDPALLQETRLISESVLRSSELTRRLLTFGRKADQRQEELHLASVINNCFSLLRLTMDRRIHWEQAVPPDLPPLYFNATDLNQIILNLVINARDTLLDKLAGARGEWTPLIRVEVALLPAGSVAHVDGTPSQRQIYGWQRLTIRDNGMGMPNEVRERIFEPFFTTKDVGKGTGLGLATVWHLVTEVSGRIEVESKPGEGTAFHVYLPILHAPQTSPVAAAAAAPADPGHARVFLAEDDPLVAGAITTALERAGHTVTHLLDGAVAWQFLQAHLGDFDLLVLDVNMPGLDGIELAERIRATGRYAGHIMIASGRLSSNDLAEIADARVDFVLNKPFDIAELLGAVRTCLAAPPKR